MQYRKFGKLDWEVSVLGFGAMRLPLADTETGKVDEPESIRMLRYAVDHGVNYIDTAYGYHAGQSEVIVGNALKDGYREKVKLATKLPVWLIENEESFDRFLNEQLERLQIEKLDFYLLHGLNSGSWPKVRDLGVIRWAEGAMTDGRFDYLAFSFHDNFETFKQIVDDYDNWTLAQVQYNYMDVDYQAGHRGVEYAANKGLAVVVMEPVRGGRLAKAPGPVAEVWENATQKRSPAEWALLWVWNQPEVSIALSGMSTMEQVVENVATADRARPGILTTEELALVDRAREVYKGLAPIPCTNCRYCMPCSSGVEISRIFQMYNEAIMYDYRRAPRWAYSELKEEQRGDQCTKCGECMDVCPQEIDIPEWLQKAHMLLAPKAKSGS
ncbi:MAG: aldo/keto reductase [Dehalococcoidales bacterium]|nr:MAG: aldo/keto reductase [Dehalococcoidales bacterium]